jgi:hypothetical protein
VLPSDNPAAQELVSVDVAGMALLALSIGAFALATTTDAGVEVALVLAGLALSGFIAFLVVESTVATPLVEMELLGRGTLCAGIIAMALVSSIMMAALVVAPFYLSAVLELGPLQIGFVISVGPAVAALVGVPAGRLVDHLGATRIAVDGLTGRSRFADDGHPAKNVRSERLRRKPRDHYVRLWAVPGRQQHGSVECRLK